MSPQMIPADFQGFQPDLFTFLAELAFHNDRDWFNQHKARYEAQVRGPALAFIRAMGPHLEAISPHFVAVDKKSGGSMMRPYRDTRFSKDKTPFKTNVGIQLRHVAGKDVHAPAFYLHLAVDECFLGCGMWHPPGEALAAVRALIDEQPARWIEVRDDPRLRGAFEIQGESLKRPPRGYPKDHPLLDDLRRKDHIVGAPIELEAIVAAGADFPRWVADRFALTSAYMRFLCDAVAQPF